VDVCAQCGHQLGIGRFCTNCGHPVGAPVPGDTPSTATPDWRTDTAERPRAVPAPAPPVSSSPEPARYPLYADEATPPPGAGPPGDTATFPAAPAGESPGGYRHVDESQRRGAASTWVPWVAGLTVMLMVAAVGLWMLLGDDADTAGSGATADPSPTEQAPRDDRTPQGRATVSPAPRAQPGNLAGSVTVRAPRPAPPTQDVNGSPVTFVAAHMLDGIPQTCWRMVGDGTGEAITFELDQQTEMTEVGLVNGYAKTASSANGTYDWYAGNRRIREVEWTFDDGTVVTQDLRETRRVQTIRLDSGVVTEQVTMRLIEVSPPGPGRASRNNTAISEVFLRGALR